VKIAGQLDLGTEDGRNALSRLKKGIVRNLSVGFEITEKAFAGAVRTITAGVIREVSLVVFGANPRAVVTVVKEPADASSARELLPYLLK
jgi:HK97 family phage prohead protease